MRIRKLTRHRPPGIGAYQALAGLLLLLLAPTPAVAQRVAVGVKAGASSTVFTQRSTGETYRWERGYGPVVGAGVTLQLTRVLGVRGEAVLAQRASAGGVAMRISYYEFPVLAVLR